MTNLNKVVVTGLSLFALSGAVLADNINDDIREAKAGIEALNSTLVELGVDASTKVNFNGPLTSSQKLALYENKYSELQQKFDSVHFSN